ncbi:hypothetical protein FMN50_20705 [Rhodobacterales bacterium]|nr:hypothetical protein FMN50_20705 [Rhodobacterales bacterium]
MNKLLSIFLLSYGLPGLTLASDFSSCGHSDTTEPTARSGETNRTNYSHFKWIADADIWSQDENAVETYHSILNLSEIPLSASWEKARQTIPYAKSLTSGYCTPGSKDYGPKEYLFLDFSAPISTFGDGKKSAVAFVFLDKNTPEGPTLKRIQFVSPEDNTSDPTTHPSSNLDQNSSTVAPLPLGAEIWSYFESDGDSRTEARGLLLARYDPQDGSLSIDVKSGKNGEYIAFPPLLLGLDAKTFQEHLREAGVDSDVSSLRNWRELDEISYVTHKADYDREYVFFSSPNQVSLQFTIRRPDEISQMPFLLFAPHGDLLLSKYINTTIFFPG